MKTKPNPLEDVYAKICAEIVALTDHLAKLSAVKAAMEQAMAYTPALGDLPTMISKSPTGSLKEAILGVLSAKELMANADIRAKLKAAGYAYSLTPLHVSKTLTKLARAKRVVRVGAGSIAKYRLLR